MYFDMLATKKCVLIENHMSLQPEVRKMSPFGERKKKAYISEGCWLLSIRNSIVHL